MMMFDGMNPMTVPAGVIHSKISELKRSIEVLEAEINRRKEDGVWKYGFARLLRDERGFMTHGYEIHDTFNEAVIGYKYYHSARGVDAKILDEEAPYRIEKVYL